MKRYLFNPTTLILASAFFFYLLFSRNSAGINSVLISLYSIALFFALRKQNDKSERVKPVSWLLIAGLFASSLSVVFAHTDFSIIIFWCCFFFFIGNFAYQNMKHLQFAILLSFQSLSLLPVTVLRRFTFIRRKKKVDWTNYIRFVFLPVFTIVILFVIYSYSNDLFFQSFQHLINRLGEFLNTISFDRILFFLLGVLIFTICFIEISSSKIIISDSLLSMNLERKKRKSFFQTLNRLLYRKKQMAIFLFFILNLMIFWLNYLDISHIWFNFQWDGGYLKEMVHEGTYLLIVAILISIAVSVYYLNSNILFMKDNRLFKTLVIVWLIQNAIMIASVSIRNSYYIEYFALAYKRIFVYFFLAMCLIGLASIIYMIYRRKSIAFLLSLNSISVYLIIILSACFNWDGIIARYNFAHYNQSFVHFNFLIDLNDSALADMNYTEDQLSQIKMVQSRKFSFSGDIEYANLNFTESIRKRKEQFKSRWEKSNFLEWNYPESRAYQRLFD